MPTGYTSGVQSGKVTELKEFAFQCARGFGALIEMRDAPGDASIPDKFEPSSYKQKALEESRARLADLNGMTSAEADAAAQQAFKEASSGKRKHEADNADKRARYELMVSKVLAWMPPTPEHIGLKDFMLDQLRESIKFDCNGGYWQKVESQTGAQWLAEQIAKASSDIDYHTEEYRKECDRAAARTAWIKALKASLS